MNQLLGWRFATCYVFTSHSSVSITQLSVARVMQISSDGLPLLQQEGVVVCVSSAITCRHTSCVSSELNRRCRLQCLYDTRIRIRVVRHLFVSHKLIALRIVILMRQLIALHLALPTRYYYIVEDFYSATDKMYSYVYLENYSIISSSVEAPTSNLVLQKKRHHFVTIYTLLV